MAAIAAAASLTVPAAQAAPYGFTWHQQGTNPLSQRFTLSGGGGPIAPGATWFFGDGSPAVDGQVVDHTYAQAGTYEVSVSILVTDVTSSVTHEVTVDGVAPTSDSLRVTFTGGLSYNNLGPLTSGDFRITPKTGSFFLVSGSGTLPSKVSGEATVSINALSFFGIGLGNVVVNDPGAIFYANAPVVLRPIGRTSSIGIRGNASWFTPNWYPGQQTFFNLDFVINDEA